LEIARKFAMQLEGRSILITGAGSGIGRALAVEAARRGASVCLVGRRADKLEETLRLLDRRGSHLVVAADITRDDGIERIRQSVASSWKRLDILVNNAGRIDAGSLESAAAQDIADLFTTNIVGPMLLTQRLLPLIRQGREPRIVNIGSMFGEIPFAQFAAYSASKAAVKGFSVALRRELLDQDIAVTYVAPRATDTAGAAGVADAIDGAGLDDPARVAAKVWNAVRLRKDHVYPSPKERVFMTLQAIAPRLVDRATTRKPAGSAFNTPSLKETTHAEN
jgi:short-subunit dehydrogenase